MSECKCGSVCATDCICDNIGEMDTLVGMCARCCKYACTCERVLQQQNSEEIDAQSLRTIIGARGLRWVLRQLCRHAEHDADDALSRGDKDGLSRWATVSNKLDSVTENVAILTLAQK